MDNSENNSRIHRGGIELKASLFTNDDDPGATLKTDISNNEDGHFLLNTSNNQTLNNNSESNSSVTNITNS